ncbi:hypothetical protein M9Q43_14085, partial [Flavobacterium sp. HXWNR29]|uniref:jacalin-like lectin n=1 Tax=Flavobacterium odoriferum TaxID=2946604 RepID=UPI0021CAE662
LRPRGHGPYGTRDVGEAFKSPMPLEKNERIAGIFGTAHTYLVSIGLYVNKEDGGDCNCSHNY